MKRSHFDKYGYVIDRGVIDVAALSAEFNNAVVGQRIFSVPVGSALWEVIPLNQSMILALTEQRARPVRLIYFDKTADANWALGWHQDRTIAVNQRAEIDGFGPWSTKGGVPHVEPPFCYIEKSVTVRISIDPSDSNNGALEVIPGSHRMGKLSNQAVTDFSQQEDATVINTQIGDMVYLSTPILHRSSSTLSTLRRRTLQIDYSWADLPSPLQWAFAQ